MKIHGIAIFWGIEFRKKKRKRKRKKTDGSEGARPLLKMEDLKVRLSQRWEMKTFLFFFSVGECCATTFFLNKLLSNTYGNFCKNRFIIENFFLIKLSGKYGPVVLFFFFAVAKHRI